MKKISLFFPSIFLYLFIGSFFYLSLSQLESYDVWLHLKTGEWIVGNLAVPHTQLFSYSIGEAPWISHSWLFLVLNFLIYKFLGGINSLILFRAIIISATLWVGLRSFLNKVYFPVFLLASWLFSELFLMRASIRPELMSAVFLALYLYILLNRKKLWWLVLIQCLWVNMHGYSIFGPILLSLFILCEFIKRKIKLPFDWNKNTHLNDKKACTKSLAVLFIIVFLFLVNPYGINALRYPFFAIKSFLHTTNNLYSVSELSSLSLSDILFTQKHVLLTFTIALFMFSLLFNVRRLDLFNILIFIIFFSISCAANRHKGFFAVVSYFCILDNFKAGNLEYLKNFFKTRYLNILSVILTFLVVFFIARHQFLKARALQKRYVYSEDLSSKNYMFGVSGSKYPKKAVDFMLKNHIKGPIFNSFNIGGYLVWRLYPAYKVFVDGRTEVYGKNFMGEFAHSITDFEKWGRLDKKHSFNTVILDYSSMDVYYYLIKKLYDDKGWKLVYFGDMAVIFIKDSLINKSVISTHNISFKNMKNDVMKIRAFEDKKISLYPEYFLNRARFFINAMGMPGEAFKNLEKARLINPKSYEVYQLLGYTYFKIKMFKEAKNAFERSLEINPHIAEPYVNIGSVAAEMGLYKDAYLLYKQALSLDKNNKAATDNLNRLPKNFD